MTNIVLIVGNVGQDPVARSIQSGASITSLSVATSRKFRNSAEELVEETEWHRVTCFNGLGKNVASYVRRGMKVAVEGRLVEQGRGNAQALSDVLMTSKLKDLHSHVLRTVAAPLTDPEAKRMAESVRATFNT